MERWPSPADLAKMDENSRVQAMVRLGRDGGDAARAALAAVEADGVWGRRLALFSAYGSRDGARVLAGLQDSSQAIVTLAARMVPRVCTDEEAGRALELAPGEARRRGLLKRLAQRRGDAVDRWLTPKLAIAAADDAKRLIELLPYCSPQAVESFLPQFIELASPIGWGRLVAWQPGLAARALGSFLADSTRLNPRQQSTLQQTLLPLTQRSPDAALELMGRALALGANPTDPGWAPALRRLAELRPVPLFDLLHGLKGGEFERRPPGSFSSVRFNRRAETLGVSRLGFLIRSAWNALPDDRRRRGWFKRLSAPERLDLLKLWLSTGRSGWGSFLFYTAPTSGPLAPLREAAFERWRAAVQGRHGLVAPQRLAELPGDLRHRVARELYAHPELAQDAAKRLSYISLLPFDEAQTLAAPYIRHPEGELRALALPALIGCVELDRGALLPALQAVHARRFEQDPVRLGMLNALSKLPDGAWAPGGTLQAGVIEAVEAALSDAYDAADLSHASAMAAEKLAVRLYRYAPDWGAEALERAWKNRGQLYQSGLLDHLSPALKERLREPVEGLARRWCKQERWGAFSWVVHAIGKDLPRFPALVELLGQVARETPFTGYAGLALSLLATHHRSAFGQLAAALVQEDASYSVFEEVSQTLADCRQDLLDLFVRDTPLTGRFATGKSVQVFFFPRYRGWNPRQQAVVGRQFAAIVADSEQNQPLKLRAIHSFPDLCYIDPAPLLAWANHENQALREAAVRGLARLDGPEALPALLECMGDTRARWAIYALRQVFARMSEAEVLRTLLAVPMGKVTVAKEVVRLIGTLAGEAPYRALLDLSGQDLHRDVRIALLRALWAFIEREETWRVYGAAAASPDWVVASRLVEIPTGQLSTVADRRFCELLARVLDRPEQEARVGLLAQAGSTPVRDLSRAFFRAILAKIGADTSQERLKALHAVFVRMLDEEQPAVVKAMQALLNRPAAMLDLVPSLRAHCGRWGRPAAKAIGLNMLRVIGASPTNTHLSVGLAAELLETDALRLHIETLAERRLLGFDTLVACVAAMGSCAKPALIEHHWRQHPNPLLRRLGLAALVAAARPGEGWTAERLSALERYQLDDDPSVAGPARYVLTP